MSHGSLLLLAVVLALGAHMVALASPTITVVNQASDDATVKVVGPTGAVMDVPTKGQQTVAVSGGRYELRIRYCTPRGRCHCTRTDGFDLVETSRSVSHVTVTLHSSGGNLGETPIRDSDF